MTMISQTYPCPCTAGSIHITTENQDHHFLLDCPKCEKQYRVLQIPARKVLEGQGLTQRIVRVVRTKDALEHQKLQKKLHDTQRAFLRHCHQEHLERFLQQVMRHKTSTLRWEALGSLAGTPSRSLTKFLRYGLDRQKQVAKHHFHLERLPRILKVLGIQDPIAEQLMQKMQQHQDKLLDLEVRLVATGHLALWCKENLFQTACNSTSEGFKPAFLEVRVHDTHSNVK